MKTITVIKDTRIDNSVRVNYFHKNAIKKENKLNVFDFNTFMTSPSSEPPKLSELLEEVEVVYDNLLFCERLKWTNEESELDEQIENKRLEFETKLNS